MKNDRKYVYAPKEIKMQFHGVELTNKLANLTLEERINFVFTHGKEASEKFDAKYKVISKWFFEHDALDILSFCFMYFVMTPEGYDEEAEKGFIEFPTYYLELLQALSLAQDRSYAASPFTLYAEVLKKDIKEIGELSMSRYFSIIENLVTEEELSSFQLRVQMMSHTTTVRNWAYYHQMLKVTSDLAKFIASDFQLIHNGCDPVALIKLFEVLIDEVTERLNAHRFKMSDILSKKTYLEVYEAYENSFDYLVKASDKDKREIWTKLNENLKDFKVFILSHSDLQLKNLLTFNLEQLFLLANGELTKEQIRYVFDKLSYEFGQLINVQQEHFILDNPVHNKPFIKIDEDTYFSSIYSILPHLGIRILENLINEDIQLGEKYRKLKSNYLEDKLEAEVINAFPSASIFRGSLWKDDNSDKQFENDLLVIVGSFALIFEAKSGGIHDSARRGAPERLFKTIRELIEEPSDQALRFINYLKLHKQELTFNRKNNGKNVVDISNVKYFIPIGVTLSHLGGISTNLKLLINAGVTKNKIFELAPSISLTDLQIVFDLLPFEASKIHYLQRRRELEINVNYWGDELDLLGFYLENGFNLGENEYSGKYLFNLSLKSKELDPYIIGSAQGKLINKPQPLMTDWWKTILTFMANRKLANWIESSYILLNLQKNEQEEFEKLFNKMVKDIHAKKLKLKHNWVIFQSANPNRKFVVLGYPYKDIYLEERNEMMRGIMGDEADENKGIILIGVNLNKPHYPYSVLASILNPNLFDSEFSTMVRS